jgi:O-antigen ligase
VLVGPQGSYQAHNLWLLIGVELGTAGLVLFLAGLGVAFVEALRIPRALRGPPLAALVGLCVGVFFLSSMEFKFFWMVLILIAMTRNVAEAERHGSEASVVRGEPHVPVGAPLGGG